MYSMWTTFFGIPLSQRKENCDSLDLLNQICEDGWAVENLDEELLAEYQDCAQESGHSKKSFLLVKWCLENKEKLNEFGFDLNSSYAGEGENPRWFGFEVDMPHKARYGAELLPAKHAEDADVEKAKKVYEFFNQAPPEIAEVLIKECGFYSIHRTS